MALWQRYYQPSTVEAALALLAQHQGQARVVSGGTDLLLEMQQGHKPPVEALVDVTGIEEMCHIEQIGEWVEIGAAVTHTAVTRSDLLKLQATCLVEGCGVIGGPQVRNVGTLGGNVAHALPAADGTSALIALAAEAEVATVNGRSWRPLPTLFKGPGLSAVDQKGELITRFRLPTAQPGSGSAFKRIMRPQGVALPILACAAWVQLSPTSGEGEETAVSSETAVINEARICLGPVRPLPCRATRAEAALIGRTLEDALEECVAAAQAEFSPRASKHRATAEYRTAMIEVLLKRVLPLAVHRAATQEITPEGIGE